MPKPAPQSPATKSPEPQFDTTPVVTEKPFADDQLRGSYFGPKPLVLLILDGWGIGPENAGNAIARAQTPNIDSYSLNYPHTQLGASGEYVGLPKGEDGNTETGHLNIGAGTIVYQSLPRINATIADHSFLRIPAFVGTCEHVKRNQSRLHLMGLVGDGAVHSNVEHLYALLQMAKEQGVEQVFIHGFTDGRDSPPTSGIEKIKEIEKECKRIGVGKIASLMGRYYAMDRDQRWDRVAKAYHCLTLGEGLEAPNAVTALQQQYDQGTTDEFIEPVLIVDGGERKKELIQDSDGVIFFNYRIDRPRELTKAFVLPDFESGGSSQHFDPYSLGAELPKEIELEEDLGAIDDLGIGLGEDPPLTNPTPGPAGEVAELNQELNQNPQAQQQVQTFQRKKVMQNLYFTTMTQYEKNLPVDIAFTPQLIENPICKIFSEYGLRQLRMAETEKERFVTYYLNGMKNEQYPGEDRVIIPSKGVKSYDEVPEMSAREIAQEMLQRIESDEYDVIIANFANPDMVGHTGNLEAAIQTCELTDELVGQIVQAVYPKGGTVLITGDHGNVEEMINNITGEVDTEHSTYPVPLLIIGQKFEGNPTQLPEGILSDVAPTMLSIMGIEQPESMTGRPLI